VYRGEFLRADREGARAVLVDAERLHIDISVAAPAATPRRHKRARQGTRALLVDAERLDIDISVAATAPTRSRDNRAREGMPDLSPTFEIGPNVNWTLARGPRSKLQLRLTVRAAVALESGPDMIGWLATPHLNLDLRASGWNVGMLTGPVIGRRRMDGYLFDVAAQVATAEAPD